MRYMQCNRNNLSVVCIPLPCILYAEPFKNAVKSTEFKRRLKLTRLFVQRISAGKIFHASICLLKKIFLKHRNVKKVLQNCNH